MRKNYFICGLLGWCAEILFTSIGSLVRQDWRLMATTSLWMFPIYGLASFIPFIYEKIKKIHWFLRGLIYTFCIFFIEYVSGSILTHFKVCPWSYVGMPTNYKGIIRLDYAPLWFILGLFYEQFLNASKKRRSSTTTEQVTQKIQKQHGKTPS